MRTHEFTNQEDWLAFRRGRISGTRVKDVIVKRGTGRKICFYELIAEKLGVESSEDENPMERGLRLEEEAINRFRQESGKKVVAKLIIWTRDDNDNIAISPDAVIGKTEALEVKCLSSAKHLEAYLTQSVPAEYQDQAIQYFVVNEKLKTLYFAFFDPRLPVKQFFYLTLSRKMFAEKIAEYEEVEKMILNDVMDAVKSLQ